MSHSGGGGCLFAASFKSLYCDFSLQLAGKPTKSGKWQY